MYLKIIYIINYLNGYFLSLCLNKSEINNIIEISNIIVILYLR